MHIHRNLLVISAAFLLVPLSAEAAKPGSRSEIKAEVERLWSQKSYDRLDELERYFLAKNEMTESGWPSAFLVNQAIDEVLAATAKNPSQLEQYSSDLTAWLQQSPSSYFGNFAYANILIERAWKERGTGYANSVSSAQFEKFRTLVDQASEHLTQNKEKLSSDPYWYSMMFTIAQVQSWPPAKFKLLLTEAVGKHGSNIALLTQAINYYHPKWGGSYEEMAKFISENTAKLPPSEQDASYARQYSYTMENGLFESIPTSRVDCKKWLHGVELIANRYPTHPNLNHAAYAAYRCSDHDTARNYFTQMGAATPELWMWGGMDTFNKVRTWATNDR